MFCACGQSEGGEWNGNIKTGLTTFTDCSKLQICASKACGVNAVYVAVARILIALEGAASCCTRGSK
jgi:hypothetical protein